MENIYVGGANKWLELQNNLSSHSDECVTGTTIKFCIPLDVLAPCLQAFPNSVIWLGQGQMLKM